MGVRMIFIMWGCEIYLHGWSSAECAVCVAAILVSLIPFASRRTDTLMIVVAICALIYDVWDGLVCGLLQHAWARAGDWSVAFGGGYSTARWPRKAYRVPSTCAKP